MPIPVPASATSISGTSLRARGAKMAAEYGIELLGQLPLQRGIREQADNGNPTVAADAASATAMLYRNIARKLAAKLAQRAKDYSSKFPSIVIKND